MARLSPGNCARAASTACAAASTAATGLENELREKTDRRDELLARQGEVGPEKLIERELAQAPLEPQIPIVQDLIVQVTAHRATLPS